MSQEKGLAPESWKTKKAREKLRKSWVDFDRKITPDALKKKVEEIHRWIARNAKNRIRLKNKNISLFDENQNTAKIGPRVRAIAQRLQLEIQQREERSREFFHIDKGKNLQ